MKAQPKLKKRITEYVKMEQKAQALLAQLKKLDTSKLLASIEAEVEALVAQATTQAERDHWDDLLSAIQSDFKNSEAGLAVAKSYMVAFDKACKKAAKLADAEVKEKKAAEAKAKREAEEAKRIAKENAKLQARLEKAKLKEEPVKEVQAGTAPVEVPTTPPVEEAPATEPKPLLDL